MESTIDTKPLFIVTQHNYELKNIKGGSKKAVTKAQMKIEVPDGYVFAGLRSFGGGDPRFNVFQITPNVSSDTGIVLRYFWQYGDSASVISAASASMEILWVREDYQRVLN